jgi:LemA protein
VAVVIVIVILLLAVIVGLVIVAGINRLRRERVSVDEAFAGVEVQLTRRADLIPNLVNTVKGYMTHERETLEAVTDARAAAKAADSVPAAARADAQMQQALANLYAVAENYPDLKASTNFMQLQGELSRTEDQLAFSRQYYNDSVATLNRSMVTIPWSLMVGLAKVDKGVFYDAPDEQTTPPTVQF